MVELPTKGMAAQPEVPQLKQANSFLKYEKCFFFLNQELCIDTAR